MEKLVFKNKILNIVFGVILIALAVVGYLMDYIADYLPYIIGAVLILLSLKRFLFTFKSVGNKGGTLVLVIEFLLDLTFAGLLIYLQDHIELFVGLIIYIRGASYLIINFLSSRKVKLSEYLFNIGYVTLGTYVVFTDILTVENLVMVISGLVLLVGLIYFVTGLVVVIKKKKQEDLEEAIKEENSKTFEDLVITVDEVDKNEEVIEESTDNEEDDVAEEILEEDIEEEAIEEIKEEVDLAKLTVAELKELAKKRKIIGLSGLKKAEIIAKLKE